MKALLKRLLSRIGYEIRRTPDPRGLYDQDGLTTRLNHDFIADPQFARAYQAGKSTGRMYPGPWRFHVAMWAAWQGARLDGDFVECGVNTGSLSKAVLEFVDWAKLNKHLHLFDTWTGLDEQQLTEEEIKLGSLHWRESYDRDVFTQVQKNFEHAPRVHFYRGAVPQTLSMASIERIAYLSIDMNCMAPEIAAAEAFWDRMSPGAVMLLDDYGFNGPHLVQKRAFDEFAARRERRVLSLPTGQGIIIR
jgi:hypothetical protein